MEIIKHCYVITPENEEEIRLANEAILNFRAERERQEILEKNREYLRSAVISTIDAIGLEETKRIIREINKNLRGES